MAGIRLDSIPTTGIGGQDEQEQRASSSVLAVMRAVPQFSGPSSRTSTPRRDGVDSFTEVRFLDADEKTSIPDGAVVIERSSHGVCLVELKTAGAPLVAAQVERWTSLG